MRDSAIGSALMKAVWIKTSVAAFGVLMAALVFALATPLRADDVSVSLTTNITGPVGSSVTVFGDVTNDTSSTLYFSDDAMNIAAPGTLASAADDLIINGFLGLEPTSIAPNSTANLDLFTMSLLGGSGDYTGNSFVLIGGTDAVACSSGTIGCDTQLGSTAFDFSVGTLVPTPEPGTLLLMGIGLASLVFLLKRLNLPA
ncbi:MAG: PEP-CTERM sorting domain-containing protein [Candidatus Acidiferrales bacterium]